MNKDELQEAIERGRATREKREAKQLDERAFIEAERAKDDQLERQRRLGWSVSWTGRFHSQLGTLYLFYLYAASSMLWVGLMTLFSIAIPHWMLPGGGKVLPVPTTIGIVIFWWWTRKAPGRAVARERAWLASLPFAVRGYEEALGDSASQNEDFLELRFQFAKEPPDDQLVDLLSGDGGQWKINPRNGHPMRDPGIAREDYDHNAPVRAWFHRLVEQQLMPLHRAHPFSELQIINRG